MPSSCSEEAVEHLDILNIHTQLSTLYRTNANTLMCLHYHNLFFHMGRQASMVHRTCICFLSHVKCHLCGMYHFGGDKATHMTRSFRARYLTQHTQTPLASALWLFLEG